jgi:excisionase family DNA binding protein
MSDPEDRLLTYKECAAKLDIHESTLRRLVSKKRIPVIEMGHQIKRFHWKTVLLHLEKNPIK